jgi:hypothetical protein
MSMSEQLKRGAEESAATARETLRKGEAKAQQTMEAAQQGFQFAGDSTRQVTLKLIEIMRANTEAFCSFAEDLINEKDAGKLAGLWVKHTQNQIDLLSRQGQELASLGQRITSSGVNTMSDRMR